MKVLYFISFVVWIGYAFFTFQSGEAGSAGGGAIGDYVEDQINFNFFVISALISVYAIALNIGVMVNRKIKGANLLAFLQILLSAGLIFWTYIMFSSSGTDLDEIYYGLLVIACVNALLSIIVQFKVIKGLNQ